MTEKENKITETINIETKEPKVEIIKIKDKKQPKMKYFYYLVGCIFILVFSIYYTHIYTVINNIKETVVYYNNQNKNLIPEIINYTKSWIINDKRVVNLIIDIMGVYVDNTTDTNKTYNNQILSVIKTNELLKLIDLHPILKTDKNYLEQRKKFNDLYHKNITAFNVCKKLSLKLLQLANTNVYKKYGKTDTNFNEIVCKD